MPNFDVDLPAGGRIELQDADEVAMWNQNAEKYIEDYALSKQNDLVLLGSILTQSLAMYRAQRDMVQAESDKMAQAQNRVAKATEEIRNIEKALGIDKKARESGGQHTLASYVATAKKAAHVKGVRISERVKAYEGFVMGLRWRLRLLRNGDAEDRAHHGISEEAVVVWCEEQVAALEEADKKWAHEEGAVFVGRL